MTARDGYPADLTLEWLEADGLGGFASGTTAGVRTRRYHALLLAATTPPTGRVALVQGWDATVETDGGSFALTSQRYLPDVLSPDSLHRIVRFELEPWPKWTYRLEDGVEIEHELFVPRDVPVVVASWRLKGRRRAVLAVRPFLSGRDIHALHHENPGFRFDADAREDRVTWRPYDHVPGVTAFTNGAYRHDPQWYRGFFYEEERNRGLDAAEDLGAPGVLRWDLARGEALCVLAMNGMPPSARATGPAATLTKLAAGGALLDAVKSLRASERRRRTALGSRLGRAADSYLVRRGDGRTIIAGYPWFTDWGRDTFIAMRGLCLSTGRLDEAGRILLEWADTVSEGMLPNRFVEGAGEPEYNSVDASLWYVIAVHDYFEAMRVRERAVTARAKKALETAVRAILTGYAAGTRYGIRADDDGLLAAGEPGVQLTWMDAKVGDWVVTPRIGKPVEVQALWLNALRFGATLDAPWRELFEHGLTSFRRRFWNEAGHCLHDVVDVDHVRGTSDPSFRPNQLLAVGGLPYPLLDGALAQSVVDAVEEKLMTRLGPRSLAPGHSAYTPRYEGGVLERDGGYHQGTVWPWLIGAFVEAWIRTHGGTPEAKREARARFVAPLHAHLDEAGLGHVSEIADADPPHTPRGCPFQAWSVAELLRLERGVLAGVEASAREAFEPAER